MKLILLKTFSTVFEAESIKNLLEAEGIKSVMHTSLPGSTGEFGNIGGGELYVKEEDIDHAKEIVETIE
ncbi:MAG: hypothetical protein A3A33_01770 [Candidatus Yanofskybacteria bacterium RIFCSPLOWO2_01_FULL_49_25]|uniref:DUF2007 domain-containing protein n=1 Tax=Candidatus Yanofskybacteria bacterium RIFCSPLOWO2_01_FULL_49_25 TaxID=1802701 RepID=A0A1F8GXB6_9BACT|nr:MAG: hypothetical protein A3A33_01770 [Candidatus Yanofskybacteria bacterium RIFCSPLOWO2_01_FULL_49_25]